MSENVPGGFAGVAYQQNNDASKLGRKQAPPDLFLPMATFIYASCFAPYNMGTHMLPCPTSYENAADPWEPLGGLASGCQWNVYICGVQCELDIAP